MGISPDIVVLIDHQVYILTSCFDPAYSNCNWVDVLNRLYQSKCPNLKGQSLGNKIRGSKLCLENFDVLWQN